MILFYSKKVFPKCYEPKYLHHLGADGYYYPCCFTRTGYGRRELKSFLNEDFEQFSIKKYSKDEILKSSAWEKLYVSFYKSPMETCLSFCPLKHKSAFFEKNFDGRNGFRSIKTN